MWNLLILAGFMGAGFLGYHILKYLKSMTSILGNLSTQMGQMVHEMDKLPTVDIDDVPIEEVMKEMYRRKVIFEEILHQLVDVIAAGVSKAFSKKR